jgi:hypothetical protein
MNHDALSPDGKAHKLQADHLLNKRGFRLLSREKPPESVSPRRHLVEELFIFQKAIAPDAFCSEVH